MRPTAKTKGYLPTLDGWRAIAVVGVLFAHAPVTISSFFVIRAVHEKGWLGVNLFFAISGLLICTRLLQEGEANGRISLANFYIRRTFRIIPPALGYLLVLALLGFIGVIPTDADSWLGALFFYRNYIHYYLGSDTHNWFTGQFWSLSVEEHFYFILPSLLVFLPRFRKSALILLTLACYLWIGILVYVVKDPNPFTDQRTEYCLPYLLVPALYSVLLRQPSVLQTMRRYLQPLTGLLLGIVVWELEAHPHRMPHGFELAPIISSATLFPLLLLSTVHHPGHFVSRFLELSPLRFVGRLSYSLYIWQQLFFRRDFFFFGYAIRYLQIPWINLLCIVLCALVSYYLIELPFIRLGQKIVKHRTPVKVLAS